MREAARRAALSVRSDPATIREVRAWVADIARDAGFTDGAMHDLAVALSEVCSNCHRHSYHGRTDGQIDLEARVEEDRLRITVRDYGDAFDAASYTPPGLSTPMEGGYGVFLIRKLMDEVEYADTGAGTQVVLVKSRRS